MRTDHPSSSDPPRTLLSIDDLSDGNVDALLTRACTLKAAGKRKAASPAFSIGLLFWEDSLRTRAGFAEAAIRLGGTPIAILKARDGAAMSAPESYSDTLRVMAGMVDIVVARTPFSQRDDEHLSLPAPLVNAGDGGKGAEHPSQALIDLFAIAPSGDVSNLRIGICGDLQSRAARSTLKLLSRRNPRELRVICPAGRTPDDSPGLAIHPAFDLDGLDALVMTGLPARRGSHVLDDAERAAYALTGGVLARLPQSCLVYCPMPAIDEIGEDARRDPRLQMFRQSDDGVSIRAALLEFMLGIGG